MKRLLLSALALVAAHAFAAEPLGRLFFTPAQRAQLDTARSQKSRATLASEREESTPVPEVITYNGVVRRSDGKSTVWINNREINEREEIGGLPLVGRVRSDGRVTLELPQGSRSIDLKVGQSVDITSGTIEEPFTRPAAADKSGAKPGADKPASGAAATTGSQATRTARDQAETAAPGRNTAPAPPPPPPDSLRKN